MTKFRHNVKMPPTTYTRGRPAPHCRRKQQNRRKDQCLAWATESNDEKIVRSKIDQTDKKPISSISRAHTHGQRRGSLMVNRRDFTPPTFGTRWEREDSVRRTQEKDKEGTHDPRERSNQNHDTNKPLTRARQKSRQRATPARASPLKGRQERKIGQAAKQGSRQKARAPKQSHKKRPQTVRKRTIGSETGKAAPAADSPVNGALARFFGQPGNPGNQQNQAARAAKQAGKKHPKNRQNVPPGRTPLGFSQKNGFYTNKAFQKYKNRLGVSRVFFTRSGARPPKSYENLGDF